MTFLQEKVTTPIMETHWLNGRPVWKFRDGVIRYGDTGEHLTAGEFRKLCEKTHFRKQWREVIGWLVAIFGAYVFAYGLLTAWTFDPHQNVVKFEKCEK